MVTKFGGQILATKFGFVPECWESIEVLETEIVSTKGGPQPSDSCQMPYRLSYQGQKDVLIYITKNM